MDYYRSIVLQEKQEKQDFWRRKTPKSHKYPSLTDRTGLTVSLIRRQIGFSDKMPPKIKPPKINPSQASDFVDDLPDDIFTKEINLNLIATIKQRHGQPSGQQEYVGKIFPQRKCLSIKQSLRCRQCEHNIIKAEFTPHSIKYRIHLFASYHVPEVKLIKSDPLTAGTNACIIIKLVNPTMHDMTITIMDLPTHEEESLLIEELKKGFEVRILLNIRTQLIQNFYFLFFLFQKSLSLTSASLNTSLSRLTSLNEEPRHVDKNTTGLIQLPDSSFVLIHRDDSTEFDDDIETPREDPKYAIYFIIVEIVLHNIFF